MKDSLWSLDLFRCESATLRTHWVLVVMDQFTRRIVGFGVHGGIVDGVALCRMFNRAICGQSLPKYLSSDHDRCFRHQLLSCRRPLWPQSIIRQGPRRSIVRTLLSPTTKEASPAGRTPLTSALAWSAQLASLAF